MEVNTTGQAAKPPVAALLADRAPVRLPAPSRERAESDLVELVNLVDDRPHSDAIDQLRRRRIANTPSGVRLQVNDAVDRVIAQIVNESNEVIKQIPPEAAVRAFARFREVTGIIFDLEI